MFIGPILFDYNLNGERYLAITVRETVTHLQDVYGERFDRDWWVQHGAPANTRRSLKEYLPATFLRRIIGITLSQSRLHWEPSTSVVSLLRHMPSCQH